MSGFRYESVITKKVHILGKDYECREPSLQEQINYEKQLKDKSSKEIVEVVLDYIDGLGVPKSECVKLPQHVIMDLLKYISGVDDKKK